MPRRDPVGGGLSLSQLEVRKPRKNTKAVHLGSSEQSYTSSADMKINFELMKDQDRQGWGMARGVPEADLLAAMSPRAYHLVIRVLPQNWELKAATAVNAGKVKCLYSIFSSRGEMSLIRRLPCSFPRMQSSLPRIHDDVSGIRNNRQESTQSAEPGDSLTRGRAAISHRAALKRKPLPRSRHNEELC